MILFLLALSVLVSASGLALYLEWGGELFEEFHEVAAGLMLATVAIHVTGVLGASLLHRENLVRAMFTGLRQGNQEEAISRQYAWAVLLPLAAAATAIWFAMRL
jgi:cytochrome b